MTQQTQLATAAESDFDDFDLTWLRAKEGVKWRMPGPDVLPAWIADMDYPVAPPIRTALAAAVERGDLGYPAWSNWTGRNPLAEPFAERMAERYGWRPRPEWLRNFSDILQVIQIVLQLTTQRGDAVALQTPAYPPFLKTLQLMGRRVVACPIERSADGWGFDPRRLDEAIGEARCRTLMIVNPHNPTGRVFTAAELEALADIALRNNMLIMADEVLADLAYEPHRHIPLASLGPEVAARTVTLTSATKAFNFAGLRCAVAHVAPPRLREVIDAQPPDLYGPVNVLGVEATKAAWRDGDEWLAALLRHLDDNRRLVAQTLAERAPAIGYDPPQAAFLAWLDCRRLELGGADPADYFRTKARVELSTGKTFGQGGAGFARLNFATSTAVLTEILHRMTEPDPGQ
ncbi:MAG TPA: aminotransferase class I/II-fold pyridoxal phosphate-dependent enzyme [Streptosporangiaceae bacterium]|nr:aminotransferase class I/II-fold pyridoxal phosphate-dependent enzyme [Streptosporangiaceae bacterium]